MWELDYKESWALKNWGVWIVVLEKTPESPLNRKKIKAVNPKGKQSWIFIGRTDADAETPVLWSPDVKNWLIGKDPDTGKDLRQEEKILTEDDMVVWRHRLDVQGFEQASGADDGQGSLACCSPWDLKELDTTEGLNWTEHLKMFALAFYKYSIAHQVIFIICWDLGEHILFPKNWQIKHLLNKEKFYWIYLPSLCIF